MSEKLIGKRIKLLFTDDPYTKLKPGDMGNVLHVSQVKMAPRPFTQIWVKWDNGSSLALIQGVDSYEVV